MKFKGTIVITDPCYGVRSKIESKRFIIERCIEILKENKNGN